MNTITFLKLECSGDYGIRLLGLRSLFFCLRLWRPTPVTRSVVVMAETNQNVQDLISEKFSSAFSDAIASQFKSLLPNLLRNLPISVPPMNPSRQVHQDPAEKVLNNTNDINPLLSMQGQQVLRKTFTQVLTGNPPPPGDEVSNMLATRKGEYLSVKIDDSLVQERVPQLKNTLTSKLTFALEMFHTQRI